MKAADAPFGCWVPARRALIARDFGVDLAAGGEFKEVARVRWVVDVTVLRRSRAASTDGKFETGCANH